MTDHIADIITAGGLPLRDQLAELRREHNVRRHVYQRWTEQGRLTTTEARKRQDRLQAAILTLEALEKAQTPTLL